MFYDYGTVLFYLSVGGGCLVLIIVYLTCFLILLVFHWYFELFSFYIHFIVLHVLKAHTIQLIGFCEFQDFVDIVLSKTQRKTPTVIHRHFPIGRIRTFYLRKVKFAQQTFHDKLALIVSEFPKLEVGFGIE